jgi:thioredoxin 1
MAEASFYSVGDDNFDTEVIYSDLPVVVDFWAPWCAPCQMVNPIVEELAHAYDGKVRVCKMNVDENKSTPARFGIRGLPALLLFKGGRVHGNLMGTAPRQKIKEMFQKAV